MTSPTISLITTVLNEGRSIDRLMASLMSQTRQPDEIIVVDGGSTDDTLVRLERYTEHLPLRILVEEGCNISRGRNVAIEAAAGDIIAATDAGVRLPKNWLEAITRPLIDNPEAEVVAGFFETDPHSAFEVAMGATVLPLASEIDAATFLPSSRSVAFRKRAATRIGGYPEWLDYCEDLVFDLRLKDTAPPFIFAPDAAVYFRPRSSMRAYFKQYYLYARGDGKADLWRKRHAIRYITYLGVVPVIFLLGVLIHPLFWVLYIPGGIIYLNKPYRRVPSVMMNYPYPSMVGFLYVLVMIPVIRIVGDIAKMLGYPAGLRWRARHHPPNWRQIIPELP